jgi:DNA-binding NtrC family response regulator
MTGISPAAMAQLMAQPWPGNVRELENRMIGIVVRNDSAETLEPYMLDQGTDGPAESLDQELAGSPRHTETIEEMEKRMLVQALHATEGDVREAASQLGISQATVYRKIKRFGISTTGADLASPPVS